jgi:hypothetical protein
MDSIVSICNHALVMLGAQLITSLTEAIEAARWCNVLWPGTRDAVLRTHPWNCAFTRASLARVTETPEFDFEYQYSLPTDPYCLRVLRMSDRSYVYRIEGRKLLTDESTARIAYVARVTDVTVWDALLKEAVAAKMAMKLALPVADSRSLLEDMTRIYDDVLSEAKGVDAQEGTPEQFEVDAWTEARR